MFGFRFFKWFFSNNEVTTAKELAEEQDCNCDE
jgi:hypothetical protein